MRHGFNFIGEWLFQANCAVHHFSSAICLCKFLISNESLRINCSVNYAAKLFLHDYLRRSTKHPIFEVYDFRDLNLEQLRMTAFLHWYRNRTSCSPRRIVFCKLSFSKMKKVQLDIYFLIITFNSSFLHVITHVTVECSKRLKFSIVPWWVFNWNITWFEVTWFRINKCENAKLRNQPQGHSEVPLISKF